MIQDLGVGLNPSAPAHAQGEAQTCGGPLPAQSLMSIADAQQIRLSPLHPEFGARLENISLSLELEDCTWDVIRTALDTYAVLVIPQQLELDPSVLKELAAQLHRSNPEEIGLPVECGPQYGEAPKGEALEWFPGAVAEHPEIAVLGINCGAYGVEDSTAIGIEWHVDSAPGEVVREQSGDGKELVSTLTLGCATIMHCILAPQEGGETLFASGAVCYDLLPAELKVRADSATVRYADYIENPSELEFTPDGTKLVDSRANAKTVQCLPLVRTHPSTGRKCVWATPRFMESVEGLSVDESRDLVSQCMRLGTAPEHVYVHKYAAGDVVIWDDRQTLHSTSPIAAKERRYGSGGVVGRRLMNNVSSLTVAAYRWGKETHKQSDDLKQSKESTTTNIRDPRSDTEITLPPRARV